MKNSLLYLLLLSMALFCACSPRNISTRYYEQNQSILDKIERSYSTLYKQKPFRVGFIDDDFETISLEIITDTLTYIYEFTITDKRLADSLLKYGINPVATTAMIIQMRSIRCTWINNFDYFVDGQKKSSVYMSIKPVGLSGRFSNKKYYILTYFPQIQYYDKEGRLVNNRKQRQLQKVNGEVFKRINDKVSYTVSSTYR